ncbi:MAG: HPr family phosphocarrier protein [Acidiferrobacteraceae bacterium]
MKCVQITIVNKLGMHARASAKFVHLASGFSSNVTLARLGRQVNGKSIMGIMMLAAGIGAELSLCADGRDEEQAIAELSRLIADRFGEAD